MSDLHFNHPLPVGTILETEDGALHKVVVNWRLTETGTAVYTVYTIESAAEQPATQTGIDFEQMVDNDDYPDWEVVCNPNDVNDD